MKSPVAAIATKQGMMKGYWKVVIVDEDGAEVEKLHIVQSKKHAMQWAKEINERGSYTTGISGFRHEQKLTPEGKIVYLARGKKYSKTGRSR